MEKILKKNFAFFKKFPLKIQISSWTYSFKNISFSLWTYNEFFFTHIYIHILGEREREREDGERERVDREREMNKSDKPNRNISL